VDVRIENVSSTVRIADSEALLTPEVLRRIVEAVKQHLEEEESLQAERNSDKTIHRNASSLT
jgi:hypothetical protein